MVIGEFTEELLIKDYNGAHAEWMEMHFPALGDILIIDAGEPIEKYLWWQPV